MMYENGKNLSRIFEIYEHLFELKQRDRSVPESYGELKSLIDELKMHHHAFTDAATLREYRQDLTMSKFLSDLNPSLRSQLCGQILGSYNILTLTVTFSRVMRVSTGTDVSPTPSIEQSVMIFKYSRDRGRDCGRNFEGGRGSFGGDRGFYGG